MSAASCGMKLLIKVACKFVEYVCDTFLFFLQQMIELCPGSGVYWYTANKNYALSSSKTAGELTALLMDTFFSKDVMAVSNMKGGGQKGYKQLNVDIISAMRGKALTVKQSLYSDPSGDYHIQSDTYHLMIVVNFAFHTEQI